MSPKRKLVAEPDFSRRKEDVLWALYLALRLTVCSVFTSAENKAVLQEIGIKGLNCIFSSDRKFACHVHFILCSIANVTFYCEADILSCLLILLELDLP